MSSTNPSASYFEGVAGEWDSMRRGYFDEAVRNSAISKAYLRPEMVVGDIGAGTGFMTAGLAPLVKQVYAFDGSASMLAVAQKNLDHYSNIHYELANGLALPLPDDSLDVVFANMYLHHCPDPLAAIGEMTRILRPGGRIIITDMDAHPHAWMKEEMADVWQGFERYQVMDWYRSAGLVNRLTDCTGQSCCAQPQKSSDDNAEISIFVAVGTKPVHGVTESVQQDYAAHAVGQGTACCSSDSSSTSCCSEAKADAGFSFLRGYSPEEQQSVPEAAAEISLGCGNPTAIANLKLGEVVLDIGSGGGIDAFLAARRVGPTGSVIGVDMTPEMISRARLTAQAGGFEWVEFRLGQAEHLPVEDNRVDVVLSNCVINLTQDKGQVFGEAFRVLREGGRLEVSDMVTDKAIPNDLREDPANWAGCIYGALPEGEYVDLIRQAGFGDIAIRRSYLAGEMNGTRLYSAQISARKAQGANSSVSVVTGNLNKNAQKPTCGCK